MKNTSSPQTDKTNRRAAGYVRVSQVGGRGGDSFLSPEVQREKVEAWAAYRGYRIVRWYVDLDVSGREGSRRPEFEQMMVDAADGHFDVVAVYRLTRFARSVTEAARRYSDLRRAGVDLASVTEDFDTSTASGALVQHVLFALAEFESARIGEEWRAVHASRRRRGIAHVTHRPFGYRIDGATIAEPEPAEAAAVRKMYDARVRGASIAEIAAMLERDGHRPVKGGRRFNHASIRRILRNPIYAGLVDDHGELLPGRHEPLVTRDLYDAVQATHGRWTTLGRHHGSLLSGLIVCGTCESRMWYAAGDYRCNGQARSHGCDRPVMIRSGPADDYVERLFLKRAAPLRARKVPASRKADGWRAQAGRLRARVDQLDDALDQLADQRYVLGTVAADEYERQAARYMAERELAAREADELEQLAATVRPLDVSVLDRWPTYPLDTRQRALRVMVARVVCSPPVRWRGPASERLAVDWI